jgi:transcriptional regulator with XRE-family HTH domain
VHRYVLAVERHKELLPLAAVIRTFRRSAGFTQEGFAYEAHLDRGFVGAVERAERNVGFRKIRQLLVGLGVDWCDFGAALQELDPLPTRSSRGSREDG